ncbi:hypothetical protein [Nocardia abscessus]|uniref:hypothetical protein n=1 Tax=Nocardia abscessus TaxID=120957 RepID=UPI002455C949|nr:hypothetical protein [Nocardia abscessus]
MSAVEEFVIGVTWQVIPKALGELPGGAEPDAAERIVTAVHGMTKIDIQGMLAARPLRPAPA